MGGAAGGTLTGMALYPSEAALGGPAGPALSLFCADCMLLVQVQIDPYLEDSMCQVCSAQPGPFFCRDQVMLPPGDAVWG